LLLCGCASAFAQVNEKARKAIDVDAIRETELTGDVGLKPTIMSFPADPQAVYAYIKQFSGKRYLTFPEGRENSIRMLDSLPKIWLKRTAVQQTSFQGTAQPGEYYVFQIGVYSPYHSLKNINTSFSSLKNGKDAITDVTCFNTEGVAFTGKAYKKTVNLAQYRVLPLWFGVQVTDNASGIYKGVVKIMPEGEKPTEVAITISIKGPKIADHGFDHEGKLSRLAWLNTRIGLDNDITTGFQEVERNENLIKILGRDIRLSKEGLPEDIESHFDNNNEHLLPKGEPILAGKLKFQVIAGGKPLDLVPSATTYTDRLPGNTDWTTILKNQFVNVTVHGTAAFDGFMGYELDVTPTRDIEVNDIRLQMPMTKEKSKYMMGLDKEGGLRPDKWNWKWDVINKHQDQVWMGGVNGGLQIKLKGANYKRELANLYYEWGPLNEPESWGNGKKGGIDITTANNGGAFLNAYSGGRLLKKGQTYHFNFELYITPFKLINKSIQFGARYYHSDIDTVTNFIKIAETHGANIINIHHKKDIYPFLDYPYMDENVPDLKAFIDSVHQHGMKAKIYYTTREISVNTKEIWAMRGLDSEIILPGPGVNTRTLVNPKGVHPWLGKNFKDNFLPGWVATFTHGKYKGRQDLAVLTEPDSRMNNFYLGGLDWMCRNLSIDGLYIDDMALDRSSFQRARKILDRERPGAEIDMHTWNHYNQYGKFASSLNIYMPELPYLDQLWIGEARNYDTPSDYWLIEISGIPFGLTSQMLNKGGNPWRGMNYGMTDRFGWFRSRTPEYLWKFWDEYHIDQKDMIGFWDEKNPVKVDNPETEATIFKGRDEVLISVANYSDKPQNVHFKINWAALGMSPDSVTAEMPEITEFQEKRSVNLNKELTLKGGEGYMIVVRKK